MKDFKGVFDTVQDIYEAFLNGGEPGWFALAGGAFYEWIDEAWTTVTYSPITTWNIPIGSWLSVNVANPPIGLSVGTYQIVSYKDYLNQVQTYCYGSELYKIKDGIATIVEEVTRMYVENEYTQPTASQIQDIPLLKYQKEKVETIEELYLRYPNGGEDGWYAMVTELNSFAYWEKDTEEWREMGGEADLSLFEKTINKVIEWSDEPSDTNYPSEKLVKETFDNLPEEIYVGSTTPTSPSTKLWIDTTEVVVPTSNIKYGRLYNWFAANDVRGIAPEGWHVPSDLELKELVSYVGGYTIDYFIDQVYPLVGGKLKEVGIEHWNEPNTGASDTYKLRLIPSGYTYYGGGFGGIGNQEYITSSGDPEPNYRNALIINNDSEDIYYTIGGMLKHIGLPIRLIKDDSINEGDIIIDGDTYNTITIGNQVWLQQNLAVKHYQNGDLIGSDFTGTVGAVTAYNNDENNVYYTPIE